MASFPCLLCAVNISNRLPTNIPVAEKTTYNDGVPLYKTIEEITRLKMNPEELATHYFCLRCKRKCEDYHATHAKFKTLREDIYNLYHRQREPRKKIKNENKIKIHGNTTLTPIIVNDAKLDKVNNKTIQDRSTDESQTNSHVSKNNLIQNKSSLSFNTRSILKQQRVLRSNSKSILNHDVSDKSENMSLKSENMSLKSENVSLLLQRQSSDQGGGILPDQKLDVHELFKSAKKSQAVVDAHLKKATETVEEPEGLAEAKIEMDMEDEAEYLEISEPHPDENTQEESEASGIEEQIEETEQCDIVNQEREGESENDKYNVETQETEYIFGDVEILDEDGEEEETVLMSDSRLLRVVEGGSKFLTLLNENQDSNDDSQIELRVSGDEETANAIIAAAKQQGGTFLKVEPEDEPREKSPRTKTLAEHYESEIVEVAVDEVEESDLVTRKDKVFYCNLCRNRPTPTEFSTTRHLTMQEHVFAEHNARIYICPFCLIVLKRYGVYCQHVKNHAPKPSASKHKKYTCDECRREFNSKQFLAQHINVHMRNRPFKCKQCGKGFVSQYTLKAHLKVHMNRPREFECDKCSKTFFTQHNLNQHERTHTSAKDFLCKECGKRFLSLHNLEVHSIVHSKVKPFICGVCEKAFSRKPEIRDHMRTHTGERPFVCDICPAAFSQRSNLRTHKRMTHLQERNYACKLCNKRFKRQRLLDYHTRSVHTGERPVICEVCGATFIAPEHKRKHMQLHSGTRGFSCEICSKMFNNKSNRDSHRFVHSDKKPFECLICGFGCMRKTTLYQHMNTTGHLSESIVVNQPRVTQIDDGTTILETENFEPDTTQTYTDVEKNDDQLDTQELHVTEGGEQTSFTITSTDGDVRYLNAEDGSFVRLVQVKLPNGEEGWIALEEVSEIAQE